MTPAQRTFAVTIALLYIGIAIVLVSLAYWWVTKNSMDPIRDLGILVGMALTADAALMGILGSFLNLSAQVTAAKQLEDLKGQVSRQNALLEKTIDAKSTAYNKLFVATTTCYRELQNLTKGDFDKTKVDSAEALLTEAEGLSANLDDDDRKIVERIVQSIMNIRDEVEQLKSAGDQLKKDREAIWTKYAPELGKDMDKLRERSPFYNQKIK